MSTQKIDCSNESLYIYKDPSSYINIFASTASNSGSTGYAYDKDDYNHATGFSNEENCYEYLKLNNESFYREAHAITSFAHEYEFARYPPAKIVPFTVMVEPSDTTMVFVPPGVDTALVSEPPK